MIYFFQIENNGPIKIGYTSTDYRQRLAAIKTACPYELDVLFLYAGDEWSEKDIHKELSPYRLKGEWFEASEKIYDFINESLGGRIRESLLGKLIDVINKRKNSIEIHNDKYWVDTFWNSRSLNENLNLLCRIAKMKDKGIDVEKIIQMIPVD